MKPEVTGDFRLVDGTNLAAGACSQSRVNIH
jgi:hypothetical protein